MLCGKDISERVVVVVVCGMDAVCVAFETYQSYARNHPVAPSPFSFFLICFPKVSNCNKILHANASIAPANVVNITETSTTHMDVTFWN